MLRTLQETDLGRQMRASTYATAIVNFCAPLVVAALTGTPIFLHQEGVIPDFGTAALSSTIIAVGIIFLAGYHLGSLGGRRRRAPRRPAAVARGIPAVIGVVEVIGALLSNSLSLLWTYKGRTRWDSNP